MTTQIKLKKSSVSGNIPDSGDLQYGELAINFADGKLFYKNSSNEVKAFIDSAAVQSLITTYQGLDSSGVTNLVDSAYIQARQTFSTFDSGSVTSIVDSAYVQERQIGAGFALYEYNATAGQSTFQDSDLSGDILSYSENNIMVHYNGILLSKTEYTATDGTSVVLDEPADSGSIIMIAKWLEGGQDTLASGGGSSSLWYGDRALIIGGNNRENTIDYYNISSPGNATDFGDVSNSGGSIHGTAVSNGTRTVFTVYNPASYEYVTTATTGNSSTFGDLVTDQDGKNSVTDASRGVFAGNDQQGSDMEYITINTESNATDFGYTLTVGRGYGGGAGNGTIGLFFGGQLSSGAGRSSNVIDYITIQSPSNASDFGDLSQGLQIRGATSDATRAVVGGGMTTTNDVYTNEIQYVTMASAGNTTDFGDLTRNAGPACTGDGTYATWAGGVQGTGTPTYYTNVIDRVTIQTTGNASDFGDLSVTGNGHAATSGDAS